MASLVIGLGFLYKVLAYLAIINLHALLATLGFRIILAVHVAHVPSAVFARDNLNIDWLALLSDRLVVKVVKVSRPALVENSAVTKSKVFGWRADGEASSVDGTSLSSLWIELELVVGNDGASAALGVKENTVLKVGDKSSLAQAGSLLHVSIAYKCQHRIVLTFSRLPNFSLTALAGLKPRLEFRV